MFHAALQELDIPAIGKCSIHHMTEAGLCMLFDQWIPAQGWIPMVDNARPFFMADTKGYYFLVKNGVPIASLMAVKYPHNLVFIGGFITFEATMRSKGIGAAFFKAIMELRQKESDAPLCFELDCIEARTPLYQRLGFEVIDRDTFYRFTPSLSSLALLHPRIVEVTPSSLTEVYRYDAKVFGVRRDEFLREWIGKRETKTVMMLSETNQILGYGVLSKRCMIKPDEDPGYRLGPVFADSAFVAREIINALCHHSEGKSVIIETPGRHPEVAELCKSLGFEPGVSLCRMRRTKSTSLPNITIDKVWGWGSLAIGG